MYRVSLRTSITRNPLTGVSKGFGFVWFEQERNAVEAITHHSSIVVDDRRGHLRVKWARPDSKSKPTSKPSNGPKSVKAPSGSPDSSSLSSSVSPAPASTTASSSAVHQNQSSDSFDLFISNLAFSVTNDDLLRLFSPYSPISANVVREKPSGRSKGFGFVKIPKSVDSDYSELSRVISEMQKVNLNGRAINVKPSHSSSASAPSSPSTQHTGSTSSKNKKNSSKQVLQIKKRPTSTKPVRPAGKSLIEMLVFLADYPPFYKGQSREFHRSTRVRLFNTSRRLRYSEGARLHYRTFTIYSGYNDDDDSDYYRDGGSLMEPHEIPPILRRIFWAEPHQSHPNIEIRLDDLGFFSEIAMDVVGGYICCLDLMAGVNDEELYELLDWQLFRRMKRLRTLDIDMSGWEPEQIWDGIVKLNSLMPLTLEKLSLTDENGGSVNDSNFFNDRSPDGVFSMSRQKSVAFAKLVSRLKFFCLELEGKTVSSIPSAWDMSKMNEFMIEESQLTSISRLSTATNLSSLYLLGTNITDISPLSGLVNLKNLSLRECIATDFSALAGVRSYEKG